MGPEVGRAETGAGDEGSASPTESFATDNPPPSPCLDNDFNEDDATPRQQWSPVHTVGGRGANPNKQHTRGYNGGSVGGGTFAGAGGERRAHSGRGSRGGGGEPKHGGGGGSAVTSSTTSHALFQKPRQLPAPPDSPVLRVDLERLDLSVLALGEEGGPTVPHNGGGVQAAGGGGGRRSEMINPGAFRSEPGPVTQEGRPRSLGGRPSRVHALFVKPGQLGTGPNSPPSSYSTHSESGFASPTTRLASPFGQGGAAALAAAGPREHPHPGRVKKGKWKRGKAIGVGSCGNVYLGMNEDTGELMAVKEITLETKDRLLTSLYNEIQVQERAMATFAGVTFQKTFLYSGMRHFFFLHTVQRTLHTDGRAGVCLASLESCVFSVCLGFLATPRPIAPKVKVVHHTGAVYVGEVAKWAGFVFFSSNLGTYRSSPAPARGSGFCALPPFSHFLSCTLLAGAFLFKYFRPPAVVSRMQLDDESFSSKPPLPTSTNKDARSPRCVLQNLTAVPCCVFPIPVR